MNVVNLLIWTHLLLNQATTINVYKGKKEHKLTIKKCSQSDDIIESLLKPQCYMKMDTLASRALHATKQCKLKIYPTHQNKLWEHYLSNIQPWCSGGTKFLRQARQATRKFIRPTTTRG